MNYSPIECLEELNRIRNLLDYGITPEQYDEMLESQGGVCAICKKVCRSGKRLAVDHGHSCCPQRRGCCGKCVRGLLCRECNTGMELLEENIYQAVLYLQPWL